MIKKYFTAFIIFGTFLYLNNLHGNKDVQKISFKIDSLDREIHRFENTINKLRIEIVKLDSIRKNLEVKQTTTDIISGKLLYNGTLRSQMTRLNLEGIKTEYRTTSIPKGAIVEILAYIDGDFVVKYNNDIGYLNSLYIERSNIVNEKIESKYYNQKHKSIIDFEKQLNDFQSNIVWINSDNTKLKKQMKTKSDTIIKICYGAEAYKLDTKSNWTKIAYKKPLLNIDYSSIENNFYIGWTKTNNISENYIKSNYEDAVSRFKAKKRLQMRTSKLDRKLNQTKQELEIIFTKFGWDKKFIFPLYEHIPVIGMNKEMVIYCWGEPKDINKTTSKYLIHEQWVYSLSKYAYFDNNILTTLQE